MKENLLLAHLENHLENKLPFVVYATPGSSKIVGLFQNSVKTSQWEGEQTDGFVFVPFMDDEKSYFITRDYYSVVESDLPTYQPKPPLSFAAEEWEQQTHISLVNKAIAEIRKTDLDKVVLARKLDLQLKQFDSKALVTNLLSEYPASFRYVWFHPETGIWCGATPELLLELQGRTYNTMSLAGTQKLELGKIPTWTAKEQEEQAIVTRAITNELSTFSTSIQLSETYTHQAGTIAHLRTDIHGTLDDTIGLNDVLRSLHPTPAVCGFPRALAKEFINREEGLIRSFYTGYLGIIGGEDRNSALYVNLRCMRIIDGIASIFVGGGITAESDAREEWEETSNKLQTMLKVLQPFL